ncbi:hypothetical protein SAMN02746041_03225 [Desulfacinum hydrothermale DSM 13146]|uniref:Uncharacterized protein n=1 Tax=Desulfacinum hydrothermale DSM 13146 TaxID=1121390 RepID=A0A1W1XWJ0_9BACT|nr:hypothetical protein [Desulfacinum hydrothermale]SMC28303.1 hypothetical protein SAMN02746041_03225 [Desulfacinum hydrothermale DSM 13146]
MDIVVVRSNREFCAAVGRTGLELAIRHILPGTGKVKEEVSCVVSGMDLELLESLLLERNRFADLKEQILHLPRNFIAVNRDRKNEQPDVRIVTVGEAGKEGVRLSVWLSPAEVIKLAGLCRRQSMIECMRYLGRKSDVQESYCAVSNGS